MSDNPKQYVQGDVLFYEVKSIPKNAKLKERANRGIVFAEGEHTGHFHGTLDEATLHEHNGRLFVSSEGGFTVTHQEHKSIDIPAGVYEIGIVQEYDYDEEAARNVVD